MLKRLVAFLRRLWRPIDHRAIEEAKRDARVEAERYGGGHPGV